jgi:putative glucoamylase
MPGNVWWRSWRELPPPAPFADCASDPDFSWQGQWPMSGTWQNVRDPQSGQTFPVWEGHYTYPGSNLSFIPTYAGGMFEALMADQVVPETSWGPHSFGQADARTVQVQMKYANEQLHLPVWGLSPSSTADDTGGYAGFGVEGLTFPYYGTGADTAHPNLGLSQCHGCATEDVVTPHASFLALDVAPHDAYANIAALRSHYPDVYSRTGFFDAVNPTTGAVGHRQLVLDQSMIMAALDNALSDRAMQRHFAADPVARAAQTYLGIEEMTLG